MPCTLFISMRAFGYPTQTAVDIRGVYPTNHASAKLSVVPVLPAAGQPMFADVPVPAWMFFSSTLVTVYATPSEKTRLRLGLPRSSDLPSGKTTFLIASGSLRTPPAASVAYADAISSGDTPYVRPPS